MLTIVLRFASGRSSGSHPMRVRAARRRDSRSRLRAYTASGPKSSKTPSAAVLPNAASQLMELSKRDAVGDRSISGPKKLANGSAPARQPALTGVNRSCTGRDR